MTIRKITIERVHSYCDIDIGVQFMEEFNEALHIDEKVDREDWLNEESFEMYFKDRVRFMETIESYFLEKYKFYLGDYIIDYITDYFIDANLKSTIVDADVEYEEFVCLK